METIASSLLVAALGGLAWVAYNHPREFGNLALLGRIFGLIAFAGIVGFQFGSLKTQNAASAAAVHLDLKSYGTVRDAMDSVQLPWWSLGIVCVAMLYLSFLENLPRMGIVPKDK